MKPLEQETSRVFLDLVSAFERFRQAWENAMVERQRVKTEQQVNDPPPKPTACKKLLTRPEAAEYLGVTPQTLAAWQVTGRYSLPLVKVGRSVRYRLSDLERWLASRTRGTPAD